MQCSK